jgi:hypothetical protein
MAEPVPLAAARRKKSGEKPVRDFADCPITPIGHRDGVYMFFDIYGQFRRLSAAQLGKKSDMTSLFSGNVDWLWLNFPAMDRNDPFKQVGFNVGIASEYLQRQCGLQGIFGDQLSIRQQGIWRGADGVPVVNAGDAIIGPDFTAPPPLRVSNAWLGASDPMPRPADACGPEIAGEFIESIRELWDFRDVGSEIAIMGWIGSAYLGAAPQWRPNLFLTGPAGSGKSTLLDLICALMPMRNYTNDTTKPGIEQAVGGRAMPIFVDEAADRVDQRGAQVLMDIVLSATGGAGAQGFRGTSGGVVRKIEVVGAICMASVAMPSMQPQHRARFTIIDSIKPEAGADHKNAMLKLIERAKLVAPALWGRSLARWPHYLAAAESFRTALAQVGSGPREMDQLSAILAGWWVLTEDKAPNAITAMASVQALSAFMRSSDEIEADDTPAEVLMHLMTSIIPLERTSERATVASLIERAFKRGPSDPDSEYACKMLLPFGIKVVYSTDLLDQAKSGDGIWLGHKVGPLRELFAGSAFDGDRWLIHLKRMRGVRSSGKSIRFGKLAVWATFVPKSIIFPPDDHDRAH